MVRQLNKSKVKVTQVLTLTTQRHDFKDPAMMDSLNFQVSRTSDPSRDYLTRMWTREAGGVDTSDINLSPGFLLPEMFCLIYR